MLILLATLFTVKADELKFKYVWETNPNIEICPETNVTTEEIQSALDYWVNENVDFNYNKIKKVSHCSQHKSNTIQITNGKLVTEDKVLANTAVTWYHYPNNDLKFVEYVVVRIPADTIELRQNIITHELGHAIGLSHSNHIIMKSHF